MIKIGITGGIGSGKSVVSSLLSIYGIPVYIADDEGHRLSESSPVIREKLISLLGEDLYSSNGLDRKRLASVAFGDEKLLQKINSIIHPVVTADFEQWVAHQHTNACAVESAILYESGLDANVNIVLMVYAPVAVRLGRTMKRDGATEAEIMRRMNKQMSDDIKRKKADYVIVNDGVQPLIPQIETFIETFDL